MQKSESDLIFSAVHEKDRDADKIEEKTEKKRFYRG